MMTVSMAPPETCVTTATRPVLRVQLEALGALPADVLTRLTGGHLKLSSRAAGWLLDQRVELRTIVVDQAR
jgi:hypothetical protein